MNSPIAALIAQVIENLPIIFGIVVGVGLLLLERFFSRLFEIGDRKLAQHLHGECDLLTQTIGTVTRRLQDGETDFEVNYRCECYKPHLVSIPHSPNRDTRQELIEHQKEIGQRLALLKLGQDVETSEAVQL